MKNSEKIIKILSEYTCGLSVKEILKKIDNIDKTTVYRNLEKLVGSGYIIEDFSSSGERVYSFSQNHHHHFVCNNCGDTINIGCILKDKIKEFESVFNFKIYNHSFILNGICKNCK